MWNVKGKYRVVLGVVACAGIACATAAADQLKLKSGAMLTGRVISESDASIVFESRLRGMRMTGAYPRTDVESIMRDDQAAATYCTLPIIGAIGRQEGEKQFVTAEMFRAGLEEVRKSKPDYVVLVIDSSGGSLAEMREIIEAIGEASDLRFVAYVKRAISAAAIIALRCPTICMAPDGTMGGAVAFKLGPDGTPQVIEEKFQSIVRAEFRQAAELGGNSPLIAQAMMDLDVELRLTERQGKREIVDGSGYPTGQLFKRKGTILTLTATEAERCGVSKGMAASVQEIAAVLELSSWKLEDDKAWFQVLNASDAAIEREQERRARELRDAQRAHALKEIRELESRFTAVKTSRDAAYSDLDRIVKRQEADVASLKAQWEAERVNAGDASGKPSNTLRRRLADIDREYEAKRTAAITANAEELQAAKAKVTTADTELKALYQQIVDLRDAMSKRKPASAVTAGDER